MSPDFRYGFLSGIAFVILVIVAIGLWPAKAETWIVATLAGYHYSAEPNKDYNEQNFGLGLEHSLTQRVRFAGGFYRNSNRIDSTYIFVAWLPVERGAVKLGVAAGIVSGYEREPLKVAFPVLAVEGKSLGANITLVPRTNSNAGAVGLQLKWRWN